MESLTLNQRLSNIERLLALNTKSVLNVDDLCLLLDTTRNNIYRMTCLRQIPYYKPMRGRIYFKREEIEDWMLRNRSASIDEIQSQAELYCATHRN